jgi:hypothetical protein
VDGRAAGLLTALVHVLVIMFLLALLQPQIIMRELLSEVLQLQHQALAPSQ